LIDGELENEFHMGALDDFLDSLPETFDVTTLLDEGVEAIEGKLYDQPTIYKYFPSVRRAFFTKPQVRFSPREALNDPLEMSRRWREISTEGIRAYIKDKLNHSLPAAFASSDLLVSMLAEEMLERGLVLHLEQKRQVQDILESDAGQVFLKHQLDAARQLILPVVDVIFSQIEAKFEEVVHKAVSTSGVLCLTEDPLNHVMWAHYGDQGKGFVVGFDPNHPFFIFRDDVVERNLLKKLIYTEEHTENFWRNPYYLFLVKAPGWAYEKEWRLFKKFETSDQTVAGVMPHVHLWNLPSGMIRTAHFGYQYDEAEMKSDIAGLLATGCRPVFYKVVVDREMGALREQIIDRP
jgi:hypothetical protein